MAVSTATGAPSRYQVSARTVGKKYSRGKRCEIVGLCATDFLFTTSHLDLEDVETAVVAMETIYSFNSYIV